MGGVLVDDQRTMLLLYRRLFEHCNGHDGINSPGDLLSMREELLAKGDGRHWVTAIRRLVGEDDWFEYYREMMNELRERYIELNRPIPGIGNVLAWTSEKFKIALAANQFTDCRRVLELAGWLEYFKVFGISEEIGHKKPEPEFFAWILDAVDAKPGNCIMIGDRIDNDIAPAKRLGLRTIWFPIKQGYEHLEPDDEFTRAYIESHKRASLFSIVPKDESQEPDFTAHSPDELIEGIERIAGL